MTLADSYNVVLAKIRLAGCICIEGQNGWYHSFDKVKVKERVKEIKSEITRLEEKLLGPPQ